ncbi:N-acetylneuraminate synthase family protein [Alphaproteobacteria bacterium]|nr:N-acetylneuraminate synthase family protein [Alphaproteobacteria bacterium]
MDDFFQKVKDAQIPIIIAEIGANYGGIDVVKEMVRVAASCAVDMVKFQTYTAEKIAKPGSFFTFEDGQKVPQFEFFKKHELTAEHHDILNTLCCELGIAWTSTPSHGSDLELLENYDLPCYKTGSDDLTNLQFLSAIAEKKKPMIVSTGMCTLGEIEKAIETIVSTGNTKIILLHCVVSYPSRPQDANLRVIETLKNAFGFPVGLSDHTNDEFTSILAAQLGVAVIEKHFTLSHDLKLPDHEASLDPIAFKLLVDRVRLVMQALGDGVKRIAPTEVKWRNAARKSLVAAVDILEGEMITASQIEARRPSEGLHPHKIELIVGKCAKRNIASGSVLSLDMFQGS